MSEPSSNLINILINSSNNTIINNGFNLILEECMKENVLKFDEIVGDKKRFFEGTYEPLTLEFGG
jgi:hypothetical protein